MKKFFSEYNFWIIEISVFAAIKAAMSVPTQLYPMYLYM